MKRITLIILFLTAGAILTQGFQCASREMSTAKMKYSQKLYEDSEKAVNQELAKNPANDEAKVLLLNILQKQEKNDELIAAIKKYEKDLSNPLYTKQFRAFTVNLWTSKYQNAYDLYSKHMKRAERAREGRPVDPKLIYEAIESMEDVLKIRPELSIAYEAMGNFYWAIDKYDEAEEWYNKYMRSLSRELEVAGANDFHLYSERNEVIESLGAPTMSDVSADSRPGVDSLYKEVYSAGSDKIYAYFVKESGKEPVLYGWRVNPPKYWQEKPEKFLLIDITDNALRSLIQRYYEKEDFNTALKYTKQLIELTPSSDDIRPLLIELYQKTDQTDLLLKELNKMIQDNPNDATPYAYLGDVYRVTEEFDKSIDAYQKAVELDPTLINASLNLAVAYQNKAAKISQEESRKSKEDEDYTINTASFEPLLKDAVKLYKKVIKDDAFKNNPDVYAEIINILFVLEEKEEMEKYIKKLVALESSIPDENKMSYYGKLYNIFGKINDTERAKIYEQKMMQ